MRPFATDGFAWFAIAFGGGYLVGSVQLARLAFALLRPGTGPDLLRTPTTDGEAELVSHAVGATNVMMAFGPRWGMATSFADVAKAFVPTMALGLAFPTEPYALVCAVGVLTGHVWPVWHRFYGGGGNSPIMGMLLAISPVGLVVTYGLGMLVGRVVPTVAFLAGVVLTIPWFAVRDGICSPEFVFAIAISAIYFLGQLPELREFRRLRAEGHEIDVEHVMRSMRAAVKHSPERDP